MKLLSLVTTALLLAGSAPAQTFSLLYAFPSPTAGSPRSTLAMGGNTLYGTTLYGGTIFKVNTDGTGFTALGNVSNPNEPILGGNTLYVSTESGTIVKVNTDGTSFSVLKTLTNSTDGSTPRGGLLLKGTTLYGAASGGGSGGSGTVFKLNTDGSGFAVLYNFTTWRSNNVDGCFPFGGLALGGNTLYGTTINGGTNWSGGTLFKVNTDGSGFAMLHNFSPNADGCYSQARLVVNGDTLYGVTSGGGTWNCGTVFKLNTNGTGFTVLHHIYGSAYYVGEGPRCGLVLRGNVLYGSAPSDSVPEMQTKGTVFKVNTDGTGFQRLHIFSPGFGPTGTNYDGRLPEGGLVMSGTTLYGSAAIGGPSGNGTIFSLELAPQPVISSVTKTNGVFAFSWNANPGSTYQVQYATDAASTSWSNLNGVIVASNTTHSVVDVMGINTQRFYRVILLLP